MKNSKTQLSILIQITISILLLCSSCVGVDLSDKNAPKPEKIVSENQAILELCVQKLFDQSWNETDVNSHLKANKISATACSSLLEISAQRLSSGILAFSKTFSQKRFASSVG